MNTNYLSISDLKLLHTPEELKKCRIYDAANVINAVKSERDLDYVSRSLHEIMRNLLIEEYDDIMILFGESIIEFNKIGSNIVGIRLTEVFNSSNLNKKDILRDMRKDTTIFNKDPRIGVLTARGQALCGSVAMIGVGPMSIGNNMDIQTFINFDTYKQFCTNPDKDIKNYINSLIRQCEGEFKAPFNLLRKSTSFDSVRFLNDMTKSFIIDWFKKTNPAGYPQEELDKISSAPSMRDLDKFNEYLNKEELTEEEYELCEHLARNIIAFDQASIMFRIVMAMYTLYVTSCDPTDVNIYTFKTEVVTTNKGKKKKVKRVNIPIMRIKFNKSETPIGRFSIDERSLRFIGADNSNTEPDEISKDFFVMYGMH